MRALFSLLFSCLLTQVNAQSLPAGPDTIPLNDVYICDTFVKQGSTEIYISIMPTAIVKWNYYDIGTIGCNWKYEINYYIESNTNMYTLQGTVNNSNFFDLPNNGCNQSCSGTVYTANNAANVCSDVDFTLSDVVTLQLHNADIPNSYLDLNCQAMNILPVTLATFTGKNVGSTNELTWMTASEVNNDYFQVERSTNNSEWSVLATVPGAGNSDDEQRYSYADHNFTDGTNFYRLTQVDFNGQESKSEVIAINSVKKDATLLRITNLLGQEVTEATPGLKLFVYSDGTIIRKY